jgi:hypothetical protein
MNRLIASHFALAGFVAAIVAAWKPLVIFFHADPAPLLAIVTIYGGLSLWFAATQATKALHEARAAAMYPANVVNIADRFDLAEEEV